MTWRQTYPQPILLGKGRCRDSQLPHCLFAWRPRRRLPRKTEAPAFAPALRFPADDTRTEHTYALGRDLVLHARRAVDAQGTALGWDLLVVDRRLPHSPNFFYECLCGHGPRPHDYYAWHFAQAYFPAERVLPVFGYPFEVRVSCEGCQVAGTEATAFRFSSGTIQIGWRRLAVAYPRQQRAGSPDVSFELRPEERFGPVRATTSRRDLAAVVPADTIVDADLPIGEGFCTEGVRVFPGTPDEIEIAWQDAPQTRVAFVRTRTDGGRWRTGRGVAIGTSLRELERLAGRALSFSGFGWDYGGGMTWPEGAGEIGLRLDIDPRDDAKAAGPGSDDIHGDRLVRSDHPLIQTLRVRVEEITQSWGAHAIERDCR